MGELQKAGLRVDLAFLQFPLGLWDRVSTDLLLLLPPALITYTSPILDPCCRKEFLKKIENTRH
jgi:hypothetical protein